MIEEVEGLGIEAVVAGSCNRFAVVTSAGEAYLLPKGRPEVLDVGEEVVRLVALGSDFEVVVTEENVWVRGNSKSSQVTG